MWSVPVVSLAAPFSTQPRRSICTQAVKRGTWPDAIEACPGRFSAGGDCGRRHLHRARVRCLLNEGTVKSQLTRYFYSAASDRDNYFRCDLCLSAHCATPQVTGISH